MKNHLAATLAAALLAAGCSHAPPPTPAAQARTAAEDARREIRAVVTDPDRAARADAALVRLQGILAQAASAAEDTRRQVEALPVVASSSKP